MYSILMCNVLIIDFNNKIVKKSDIMTKIDHSQVGRVLAKLNS